MEERLTGVQEQAAIVAGTLAEYATDPETHTLKIAEAEPLLRQLIAPTRLRARLYLPNGHLVVDTRAAAGAQRGADRRSCRRWTAGRQFKEWGRRIYDGVMGVRPFAQLAPYSEGGEDGRVYQEVDDALTRRHRQRPAGGRPEQAGAVGGGAGRKRFRAIYGVLLVSTEGGDIDDILRQERFTLIEVFLVAFAVMLLSSLYLAGTIAEPVRRLAAAADRVRQGLAGATPFPACRSATTRSATWPIR